MTHHVVFLVHEPGRKTREVKRWAEVLEMARESGWMASATQIRYDEHGNEIDLIDVLPSQIEDDFTERAR